jgi:hypothetical protein
MRFIILANIPTESENKMIKYSNFINNLDGYVNNVKPEASYFFEADGHRVMALVINIDTVDMFLLSQSHCCKKSAPTWNSIL